MKFREEFLLLVSVAAAFAGRSSRRQSSSVQGACPPSDAIYPCYCYTDIVNFSAVDCENFSSLEKLKATLENTKGYNVSLGIWESRLGDIPSDFFKGQISESLHFENCKITSFGDRPFEGLENTLQKLFIYGSVDKRIRDLEVFPLSHLKRLEILNFQANDIKRVGNGWFEGGPATLKQISLEANDIEEIGDRAFVSLPNLEQLWLGNNRYKVVSRSMLPRPAKNLQLLEMSFSEIAVLPEDIFADMPNLKDVNVSGNKLQSLPQSTWSPIWSQLREVYVDRNRLECDEKLKWIFESKLPSIVDGRCYGPSKHKGKELEKMSLEDFQ